MSSVHRPIRKPKLGQNFLVDERARHGIVEALGDVSGRTVVEIGPGHGVITDLLAARAARLVALELDRGLAAELQFRFRDRLDVTVLEADVLKADLAALAPAGGTLDVVGNLPYYITSDILLHLFRAATGGVVRRAVLMMQREVAERIAARPGVREYGLLSATTQMYARVDLLFTLPPEAFQPAPEVHSSVVRLEFAPRFCGVGGGCGGVRFVFEAGVRAEAEDAREQFAVCGVCAGTGGGELAGGSGAAGAG